MCINLPSLVESCWMRNLRILHTPLTTGKWTRAQARFGSTMSTHFLISFESFFGYFTIGEIQSVSESVSLKPAFSRLDNSASTLSVQ